VTLVAGSRRRPAQSCGAGCYAATLPLQRPTRFAVDIAGRGPFRSVAFPLRGPWPPPAGEAFLERATRRFRALRSAVYVEHLASGPSHAIETTWKVAAPDRLEYQIRGGAGGIVIGRRRWDRPKAGASWESSQTTLLPQPFPPWGTRIASPHVLHQTSTRVTLSWLDPGVPSWFTATFDRRTALPLELQMTAAAHFMEHRYLAFNRQVRIRPPL
jgi:hypothetical protein